MWGVVIGGGMLAAGVLLGWAMGYRAGFSSADSHWRTALTEKIQTMQRKDIN